VARLRHVHQHFARGPSPPLGAVTRSVRPAHLPAHAAARTARDLARSRLAQHA
jgi:hypothetical protein